MSGDNRPPLLKLFDDPEKTRALMRRITIQEAVAFYLCMHRLGWPFTKDICRYICQFLLARDLMEEALKLFCGLDKQATFALMERGDPTLGLRMAATSPAMFTAIKNMGFMESFAGHSARSLCCLSDSSDGCIDPEAIVTEYAGPATVYERLLHNRILICESHFVKLAGLQKNLAPLLMFDGTKSVLRLENVALLNARSFRYPTAAYAEYWRGIPENVDEEVLSLIKGAFPTMWRVVDPTKLNWLEGWPSTVQSIQGTLRSFLWNESESSRQENHSLQFAKGVLNNVADGLLTLCDPKYSAWAIGPPRSRIEHERRDSHCLLSVRSKLLHDLLESRRAWEQKQGIQQDGI